MRPALLAGVCLCLLGLALAAPQLAANDPLLASPAAEEPATSEYGPVEVAYFRAMSYDRYTGTAWERTADAAPLSSLGPPPAAGDRVRVGYEVRTPVRTAPSPWRPTAYEGPDAVAVAGSIEPAATYAEGDRFTVTARRPAAPPSVLRRAGTNYPSRIDRYRRLPDDTPTELGSVTSAVTADADTPYESAVAINRWLRTEKNYSLTVERPDDHLATAFVTEMDAGFCQYFATAMVAMLRADGVPARYVTGYTPYERAGNGTHVIRGKYAHTWVEVYFPDVGWVAFDPTPAEPRQAARGVETVSDGSADAGSSAALRASVATTTRQETETAGYRQLDADVDVEGEVTAGATITVTVRDPNDGTPIEGAQVRFNGRPVGETDADGTVTGTVPYRTELTIAVYVYEGEGEPPPVVGTPAGPENLSTNVRDLRYAAPRTELVGSLERLSDVVLFHATVQRGRITPKTALTVRDPNDGAAAGDRAGGEAGLAWTPRRATRTGTQGGELTFGVNTTIDVEVTPASGGIGAEQPGEPLTVRATIEGRPVPNATVTAGERTATTDDDGTATIPAPYRRSATITVRREDASGEADIVVRGELSATAGNASFAGELLRVTATLSDGTPVEDATVTNGVESATTNADGVATIPAPYAPPWTIAVRRGGYSDSVNVSVETGTGTVDLDRPVPGDDRGLEATFADVPIRNASVTVDGERVGWTDGSGRADVRLPYAESATVVVERGGVTAERTVELRTDARISTLGPALPGRRVTVRATLAGEPFQGATVLRNGRSVGTTNDDGEASLRVPRTAPTVRLTVRRGAVTASTGLAAVPLAWATALGGLVAAVVLARRRRLDPTARRRRRPSLDRLRRLAGAARRDPRAALAAISQRLGTIADRLHADVSTALDRLRGDPSSLVSAIRDRLRAVLRYLHGAFSATMAERDAGVDVADDDGDAQAAADAAGSRPEVMPPPPAAAASENDIYRAWATFTAGLNCETESPAAVAERAAGEGFPESAVADLIETFREVRYGGAEATPERERRAREALDRIREAAR